MKIWSGLVLLLFGVLIYFGLRQTSSSPVTTMPAAHSKNLKIVDSQVFKKSVSTQKRSLASLSPLQTQLQTLANLKKCYESHACPFDDSDPRSYELALGKKIKDELSKLRLGFAKNPQALRELMNTARDFMTNGDGFVQEEALRIFSELPPSQESLTAITEGLHSSPDPLLLEQALSEFQRYIGTNMEPQVHEFLSGTISTGAQFSSLAVSEKISPFLNPKSYSVYEKALSTMTPGARAATNLKSALTEYRRLKSGA